MIITVCGSMRFKELMKERVKLLEEQGNVVLYPYELFNPDRDKIIARIPKDILVELHRKKIDLSDLVYIVDPGKYIGEDTRNEITYAESKGKLIRYLSGVFNVRY